MAAAPKPAPLFRPSQGVRCQVFSVRQCQGQVPRWLFPMLAQPPDPLLTSLSHQQRAILTRTGRREIIIGRIIASSSLARGFLWFLHRTFPPPINPIAVSQVPRAGKHQRGPLLPSEKPNLGQNWAMNEEGGALLSAGPPCSPPLPPPCLPHNYLQHHLQSWGDE